MSTRWIVIALVGALALPACSDDDPKQNTNEQTESDAGTTDTGDLADASDTALDVTAQDADPSDAADSGQTDADIDAEVDADTPPTPDNCGPAGGAANETFDHVYEVGPGQEYADPSEVPWESLQPGSLINIHYRPEPYASKWVIATAGTAEKPVVVRGIMDGDKRPVITGENATTRTELDFWNENRGVVKIGGSSNPSGQPSHIRVENLEITGAHPSNSFVDDGGSNGTYRSNAASFYIEDGSNLTLKNCVIHGSGNGIFITANARDVLITGNHIYGNGIQGSYYEHNNYSSAVGITFEYNRFGPLCDGCGGNNLKDRSAGLVVRYNWLEGGNRQLDLVDSGKDEVKSDPSYRDTFVYGNVLVEPADDSGNRQIIHYGGDGSDQANYRKGTLHLYHNTVVSLRNDRNTLLRLSTDDETAVMRNNIIYTPESSTLSLLDNTGQLDMSYNWLPEGWINSFNGSASGTVTESDNLTGTAPGFVDLGSQDFTLASDSPARGAAGSLESEAMPVECAYEKHQDGAARESTEDLGAL
ncbi:right-handed parallel beta-helix repeat-containing protein [Persicimonas caeni]